MCSYLCRFICSSICCIKSRSSDLSLSLICWAFLVSSEIGTFGMMWLGTIGFDFWSDRESYNDRSGVIIDWCLTDSRFFLFTMRGSDGIFIFLTAPLSGLRLKDSGSLLLPSSYTGTVSKDFSRLIYFFTGDAVSYDMCKLCLFWSLLRLLKLLWRMLPLTGFDS